MRNLFIPFLVTLALCACGEDNANVENDNDPTQQEGVLEDNHICQSNADCAEVEFCAQECFLLCAPGDPTCCQPGNCEAIPQPEGECVPSTCKSDADCGEKEYCAQSCFMMCPAGDPTCCVPGTCEPIVEPEP